MKEEVVNLTESANQTLENNSVEKYLTFFVEDQLYAVPSNKVMEIIRMQPITFMPKMPPFVKGIINLRGKIVPMVDLCLKFGKSVKEYDDRTSIIVVDIGDFNVGLIVAAVNDVTDISQNQITDSPTNSKGTGNRFVTNIATLDNTVAMVLDLTKVLDESVSRNIHIKKVPTSENNT